jgi:hypothetical protein
VTESEIIGHSEIGGRAEKLRFFRLPLAMSSSASWLGSSIAHEAEVHAVQVSRDNIAADRESQAGSVNEIQARIYEVANSSRFGLSRDEIRTNVGAARAEYNKLGDEYRSRVDAGNFTLLPGDKHTR